MIIVVAWALLIWLVVLLAFGPDMFKLMSDRLPRVRDKRRPESVDQSRTPTGGPARDPIAR